MRTVAVSHRCRQTYRVYIYIYTRPIPASKFHMLFALPHAWCLSGRTIRVMYDSYQRWSAVRVRHSGVRVREWIACACPYQTQNITNWCATDRQRRHKLHRLRLYRFLGSTYNIIMCLQSHDHDGNLGWSLRKLSLVSVYSTVLISNNGKVADIVIQHVCIVAKRCVLEQKLLLTAYRKSYGKSIGTN